MSRSLLNGVTNVLKATLRRLKHPPVDARYLTIFENATEGIFQSAAGGKLLLANPAMVRLCGYNSESELLHDVNEAGHELWIDLQRRNEFFKQVREAQGTVQYEGEFRRKDGQLIWVRLAVRSVRDAKGNATCYEGTAMDVSERKLAEAALRRSEAEARKLALVASRTQNAVLIGDAGNRIEWVNAGFTRLLGYSLAEMRGRTPGELLLGPGSDRKVAAGIRAHVAAGEPFYAEMLHYTKEGNEIWMAIDAQPVRDEAGKLVQFVIIQTDITTRKRGEWLDQDRRRLLEMVARNEPLFTMLDSVCRALERQRPGMRAGAMLLKDGILEPVAAPALGLRGNWEIKGSKPACDGCMCALAAITGQPSVRPACNAPDPCALGMELAARGPLGGAWAVPILAGNGRVMGSLAAHWEQHREPSPEDLALMNDLASLAGIAIEHHTLTARLAHEALHDALTQLPNRAMLEAHLPKWIEASKRTNRPMALLFIDLDGFKHINDTLGHPVGDQLLKQVAIRLTDSTRKSDVLVRMGGDEFVLVATEIRAHNDASRVARRVLEALAKPVRVGDRELYVNASVGIGVHPDDAADASGMLRCADAALYSAKASGRNRFEYFTREINQAGAERLELETELRQAIENDQLRLFYQPQVDRDGQLQGVEALLRWAHPRLGMVPPMKFIPIAEESGLILPIGRWVLFQACRQARDWQIAGKRPLRVAVNVSALQFSNPDFVPTVLTALRSSQLAPQWLELELTESMLMRDTDEAIEKLRKLRGLGVRIAIDDFGTGYSSLAYLQKLPIDTLKIDRSFVKEIKTAPGDDGLASSSGDDTTVIRAIASMALSLGINVLAEGVETEVQRDVLLRIGCHMMQGYLYSPPKPAEEVAKMIEPQAATSGLAIPA